MAGMEGEDRGLDDPLKRQIIQPRDDSLALGIQTLIYDIPRDLLAKERPQMLDLIEGRTIRGEVHHLHCEGVHPFFSNRRGLPGDHLGFGHRGRLHYHGLGEGRLGVVQCPAYP